jgi:spore maturation protein CgeB
MKVLLVHPGAEWSIADVWQGIYDALVRANVDVVQFALDGRLAFASKYLDYVYKQAKRNDPSTIKPTPGDFLYLAAVGMVERALRHEADWILLISGNYVHPEALVLCKRAGIRICAILTETPYADEQEKAIAMLSDVVFTNERASLDTFKPFCHEVYYYQHAMDPTRQGTEDSEIEAPSHDVVFVGTGFIERCQLLSGVNWDGIDLGLYGTWTLLGSRSKVRQHIRGGVVKNAVTTQLYRNAKIGLNLHRSSRGYGRDVEHIQGAESMNPRCYELASTGTFFMTDDRPEVREVFGDTVPTFTSPGQLEDQIRYWLAHDEERRQVAASLPGLISTHTFDDRVDGILRVLSHFRY